MCYQAPRRTPLTEGAMSKVTDKDTKNTLYCSFCGKSQQEVRKLIAGPTVFICDECVELCKDIIHEENKSSLVKSRDGIPNPKEICKVLDDYVIGSHRSMDAPCAPANGRDAGLAINIEGSRAIAGLRAQEPWGAWGGRDRRSVLRGNSL